MTAKNIDDVAQTLAEYERLAITSGAKVQIDPPEFSTGKTIGGLGWAPFWLDKENPPAVARATVYRDDVPTTVYVSWEESLPIETAQTDDGRLWRDLWEKNPMQRFGSYALRTALRRAFREVIGDRVEPDEDAPKVPAKDAEPTGPRDWALEYGRAESVVDLDALRAECRAARQNTDALNDVWRARRAELIAADWAPLAQTTGMSVADTIDAAAAVERAAEAADERAERRTQRREPQDHLPGNRAERRAAVRQKRTKGGRR